MPRLIYRLIIKGEVEVDNAVHMLDERGQLELLENAVKENHPGIDLWEEDDYEFEFKIINDLT